MKTLQLLEEENKQLLDNCLKLQKELYLLKSKSRKCWAVIDDTGGLFIIKGRLSIFITKEEPKANCNYAETIKEILIIL